MAKTLIFPTLFLCLTVQTFGQQLGLDFRETDQHGVSVKHLDSIYKSAVHVDTSLAVFKTEKEQEMMYNAYVQLLQEFGKTLTANDFRWDKPTRCFNRIYFNKNGTIDYFLFNFIGKTAEDKPSEEKQIEFQKLLNIFIAGYRFPLTSKVKFAQCSPTTYMPKE